MDGSLWFVRSKFKRKFSNQQWHWTSLAASAAAVTLILVLDLDLNLVFRLVSVSY